MRRDSGLETRSSPSGGHLATWEVVYYSSPGISRHGDDVHLIARRQAADAVAQVEGLCGQAWSPLGVHFLTGWRRAVGRSRELLISLPPLDEGRRRQRGRAAYARYRAEAARQTVGCTRG